ncbi:MAG: response regulator [Leptospiraceae bacterium]|nr:response regulator [Leptospiraceae bacterium]
MKEGAIILVIDDEVQIRRLLRISLESHGYKVEEASTGKDGLVQVAMVRPDIIILDLSLPDMEGIEILKELRTWNKTPVLILSVKDSEKDKIQLLDAGADDYLTKPFSVGELLARIRVMFRHLTPISREAVFTSSHLKVDLGKRIVLFNDVEVKLTPTEYSILRYLILHAGKVITQTQIMREVWGPNFEGETNYLRVYIAQLRKKIELDSANPQLIITEPGIGYRLILE